MATAKTATAKKAPVKKTAARKAAPKAAARKAAPKKAAAFSLKNTAEKAVNVYLGVIGAGYDRIQENMEVARKENEKRMKKLESRGAKLRKELRSNVSKIETPEFDTVVEDVKGQISKLQDQLEDVVENVKEKLTPAKAA